MREVVMFMKMRLVSLTFIGMAAFQAAAWADIIEGRVARIDLETIEITVYDPQGQPYPNNLVVNFDSDTRVRGASSMTALDRGDAVSLDVHQEESGAWHVDEVTLFQQIDARPATKNPPSTMRDVLGNRV